MNTNDRIRKALGGVAALVAGAFVSSAHAAEGPSFDCARVTSQVNRMICASPDLSARDRELAEHYLALMAQPGVDGAALAREERAWLRDIRDLCRDAACVLDAYVLRDAVLQARSRRMASAAAHAGSSPTVAQPTPPPATRPTVAAAEPAARPVPAPVVRLPPDAVGTTTEPRPFAVEPALLADARALRGQACAPGDDVPRGPGYVPLPGALPVVVDGGVVLGRQRIGADFAFLLDTRRGVCHIVDVVALPPHEQVGHVLQCLVPGADGTVVPRSVGVGLRPPGQPVPTAYWEVDIARGQLVRKSLDAAGWATSMLCREPSLGD